MKKIVKAKNRSNLLGMPNGYKPFLTEIKERIRASQLKAAVSVNEELIKLYWSIGKDLVEKQKKEDWGTKTIERFGDDIQREFPGIEGFSRANIFRMKAFFLSYEKVAQAVRQFETLPIFRIPWGHNILLLQRIKEPNIRLWYAQKTLENGWSRSMLENWVESCLYKRQGKAVNNFKSTLSNPQSDLADQTMKDPYCFEFISLSKEAKEKELEQSLVDHIQKLLVELGHGFAFFGRQYHLEIDDVDYYCDLIFYHTKLHCFVVVELKNTPFKPEYAGKIQFYISAIDEKLKSKEDNPTIGIILCKTKKRLTVEYALRDVKKPINVSSYVVKITDSLPKNLKGTMPSVKEIEEELRTIEHEKMEKKQSSEINNFL